MSQRIFAAIWLLLSLGMAWMASSFEVQFAYEPVGPKAWPMVLAVMMVVAALYLLVRPGEPVHWPQGRTLWRVAALAFALLLYAYTFQWLGFPLATGLMATGVGVLFGGSWRLSLVSGVGLGVGLYFFFDRLLDVVLPLGSLLNHLGA